MAYKSRRAKACDFNKTERKVIYERDKEHCIFCFSRCFLGVSHIFYSRAKSGLGIRENGVLLCFECHHALDNGRNDEKRQEIQLFCEKYLKTKYKNLDVKKIQYNKWDY